VEQFVSITATDAFATLAQAIIAASLPQELSGARISRVLTAAGWTSATAASGYWTLGTSQLGTTTTLSYGVPTFVLDDGRHQIAGVTYADSGRADRARAHPGRRRLRARRLLHRRRRPRDLPRPHHRTARPHRPLVTFTDGTTSTSRLTYADISPSFDGDRIANDIRVTRGGGVTQPATDTPSITKYLRRTLSRTPLLTNDAEAQNQAGFLLRQLKDPVPPLRLDHARADATRRRVAARARARDLRPRHRRAHTADATPADDRDDHEGLLRRGDRASSRAAAHLGDDLPAFARRHSSFWALGSSQLGASTVLAY
jgi:hypothetical protein